MQNWKKKMKIEMKIVIMSNIIHSSGKNMSSIFIDSTLLIILILLYFINLIVISRWYREELDFITFFTELFYLMKFNLIEEE